MKVSSSSSKKSAPKPEQTTLDIPDPEPVQDLIKVERNLNSLGFFTPTKKGKSTKEERSRIRTITYQSLDVQGQMISQSATIIPSPEHGLPTTADRDKYMALMKIVTDTKSKMGEIQNPVAFTTYDLLRYLGFNTGGKNYEEVNQFLERMTATTIKSENAIYFNKSKRYQRDIFHVFDRVVLVGQSMPDGIMAQCNYVFLSQWQLENINTNYLLRMDFNAYVSLKKDIAKALFGHLHVWFYASRCRPVERRYSELCQLIDVRRWKHLSKIRQILSPSLEELKEIGYLQGWDIVRTADDSDYKLLLSPGDGLINVLRPRVGASVTQKNETLGAPAGIVASALTKRGIRENDVQRLLLGVAEDQHVMDQVEWFDELSRRMGSSMQNPPGFLYTMIRDGWPVPSEFSTSRKRELHRQLQEQAQNDTESVSAAKQALRKMQLEEEYHRYVEERTDRAIQEKFPGDQLRRKMGQLKREIRSQNPHLYPKNTSAISPVLDHHALQKLREEVTAEIGAISFETFCNQVQPQLPF